MSHLGSAKRAFEEPNKKSKYEYCIRFVRIISKLLSLSVPSLFNYKGLSVWYILYSVLIMIIVFALAISNMILKILHYYTKIDKTAVIDLIAMGTGTVPNLILIYNSVVSKRKSFINAVKQLEEISNNFKIPVTTISNKSSCENFVILTITLHGLLITPLILALGVYFTDFQNFPVIQNVMVFINLYMGIISTLNIKNLAAIIQNRFEMHNEKLSEVVNILKKCRKLKKKPESNSHFLRNYDKLCDVLDMLNEVLGLPILSSCFAMIIQTLQTLNFILEYFLKHEEISANLHIFHVLFNSLWTLILLACGTMLFYSCHQVKREAQHTKVISYKLLTELPVRNNFSAEHDLRENLLRLAEQVEFRQPCFSAANCFKVDIPAISKIFMTILAHVVLLMQFN